VIAWINGTKDGQLAPSLMFASEVTAQNALDALLTNARRDGCLVTTSDCDGFVVWAARDPAGRVVRSWWLSEEENGPGIF
jgi:hypothetical protein